MCASRGFEFSAKKTVQPGRCFGKDNDFICAQPHTLRSLVSRAAVIKVAEAYGVFRFLICPDSSPCCQLLELFAGKLHKDMVLFGTGTPSSKTEQSPGIINNGAGIISQ